MRAKIRFGELCKDKKKGNKKIRNAKTEREIWGYINKGRKKKTQAGDSINREKCRGHFRNTLNGKEERTIGENRIIVMLQDDIGELKDIEIEEQMDKQKTQEAS